MREITPELKAIGVTDEYVDERIRCAIQYTDISGLSQCIVALLYDLQDALQAEDKLRHEIKRNTSLAIGLAVNITNNLTDEMGRLRRDCVVSHVKLYDKLINSLDKAVMLTGSSRYVSMIETACAMIADKFAYLHKHHHLFTEVASLESMPRVAKYLRAINCERHDLESIFRPVLASMLTAEEKAQARDRFIDTYQKVLEEQKEIKQ